MGQPFKIVNVDKLEVLSPYDYGGRTKLTEWAYERNPMVVAFMNLLEERWRGDQVFVIGEYADANDTTEPCHRAVAGLMERLGVDSIYDWATDNCARIVPRPDDPNIRLGRCDYSDKEMPIVEGVYADTARKDLQFIVNYATCQYINLRECPIERGWYDHERGVGGVMKLAPLPLLLAMGNGRGSGDFRCGSHGYELVGSWCDTSEFIRVFSHLPASKFGWSGFNPDFTEQDPIIPYTREGDVVEKKIKDWLRICADWPGLMFM